MFTKTLSADARKALAILGKGVLPKGTYMAGGSALALHFGHRISVDFDFFTTLSYFTDAEVSEMPVMLEKASWEEIKSFFEKEAIRLGKKYL